MPTYRLEDLVEPKRDKSKTLYGAIGGAMGLFGRLAADPAMRPDPWGGFDMAPLPGRAGPMSQPQSMPSPHAGLVGATIRDMANIMPPGPPGFGGGPGNEYGMPTFPNPQGPSPAGAMAAFDTMKLGGPGAQPPSMPARVMPQQIAPITDPIRDALAAFRQPQTPGPETEAWAANIQGDVARQMDPAHQRRMDLLDQYRRRSGAMLQRGGEIVPSLTGEGYQPRASLEQQYTDADLFDLLAGSRGDSSAKITTAMRDPRLNVEMERRLTQQMQAGRGTAEQAEEARMTITPEDAARATAIRERIAGERAQGLRSPSTPPDFGGDPLKYTEARAKREVELARRRANVERVAQQRGEARRARLGMGIPVPAGDQGGLGAMLTMLGHPAGPDIMRAEMQGKLGQGQMGLQREALQQQGRLGQAELDIKRRQQELERSGMDADRAYRQAQLENQRGELALKGQELDLTRRRFEWETSPEAQAMAIAVGAPGTPVGDRAGRSLFPSDVEIPTGEAGVEDVAAAGNDPAEYERRQKARGVSQEEIDRSGVKLFGETAWRNRKIGRLGWMIGADVPTINKPLEDLGFGDLLGLPVIPRQIGHGYQYWFGE